MSVAVAPIQSVAISLAKLTLGYQRQPAVHHLSGEVRERASRLRWSAPTAPANPRCSRASWVSLLRSLLHVLFGSVLAIDNPAPIPIGTIATVTMAAIALIYRPLVLECLDPMFLGSLSRASSSTHSHSWNWSCSISWAVSRRPAP
jgi:hypothetical protein